MLYNRKLHGIAIETPLGDHLGKLDGLILDLSTWKVKQIIVSPGTLKKDFAYNLSDISKFDDEKGKIVIKPEIDAEDLPEYSTHDTMILKDLMGKTVLTSDDEKLKKLYDVDFATQLKGWDLWKVLIQTPFKKRRLRVSPSDIEAVADNIVLKLSLEDIEKREKDEK